MFINLDYTAYEKLKRHDSLKIDQLLTEICLKLQTIDQSLGQSGSCYTVLFFPLVQWSVNFICKFPDGKYFRLYRSHHAIIPTQLCPYTVKVTSDNLFIISWLCSNGTLFIKQAVDQIWLSAVFSHHLVGHDCFLHVIVLSWPSYHSNTPPEAQGQSTCLPFPFLAVLCCTRIRTLTSVLNSTSVCSQRKIYFIQKSEQEPPILHMHWETLHADEGYSRRLSLALWLYQSDSWRIRGLGALSQDMQQLVSSWPTWTKHLKKLKDREWDPKHDIF